MQARATAKYVRMAPRKVRFVIDTIRGKYCSDALAQLRFTPNHAADEISKVLRSAMANAENNLGLDPDVLKVAECFVDVGPTLKRVQPRAQGRAYRILKRTSHITVVVEETTTKPRRQKAAPKQRQPLRASLSTPAAPAAEETTAVEETTAPLEVTAGEAAPTDATASSAAVNETPGEKA